MALSTTVTEALDAWFREGAYSTRHLDWQQTIKLFVDLYQAGEHPDVKDLRQWARDRGWPKHDVQAFGLLAKTVYATLLIAEVIPSRPIVR